MKPKMGVATTEQRDITRNATAIIFTWRERDGKGCSTQKLFAAALYFNSHIANSTVHFVMVGIADPNQKGNSQHFLRLCVKLKNNI